MWQWNICLCSNLLSNFYLPRIKAPHLAQVDTALIKKLDWKMLPLIQDLQFTSVYMVYVFRTTWNFWIRFPASIFLFKMNNKKVRKTSLYSKLTIKIIVLVFLLLALNIFHTFFSVSIVEFEQVNVCWVMKLWSWF